MFFAVMTLILAYASCSESFIAQEYTQISVKVKAVAEWLNTIEMKLNQLKMLAQLPQSVINQINGMKELLAENFSQVRGILQQVEGLAFTPHIFPEIFLRHPIGRCKSVNRNLNEIAFL